MTDTVEVFRPEIVYFNLDKDWLTEREKAHLEYFVKFLPEGVTLTVTGHADKETGNPRHNMGLSQRRADTVVRTLTQLGARFGKGHKGRQRGHCQPVQHTGEEPVRHHRNLSLTTQGALGPLVAVNFLVIWVPPGPARKG